MNAIATGLLAEIAKIPCVNSHTHLMPEKELLAQDVDALTLFKHAYRRLRTNRGPIVE